MYQAAACQSPSQVIERFPGPHMALVMESQGKGPEVFVLSHCSAVARSFYAKVLLNGKFKPTFTLKVSP